jgi:hypothetical protein
MSEVGREVVTGAVARRPQGPWRRKLRLDLARFIVSHIPCILQYFDFLLALHSSPHRSHRSLHYSYCTPQFPFPSIHAACFYFLRVRGFHRLGLACQAMQDTSARRYQVAWRDRAFQPFVLCCPHGSLNARTHALTHSRTLAPPGSTAARPVVRAAAAESFEYEAKVDSLMQLVGIDSGRRC